MSLGGLGLIRAVFFDHTRAKLVDVGALGRVAVLAVSEVTVEVEQFGAAVTPIPRRGSPCEDTFRIP